MTKPKPVEIEDNDHRRHRVVAWLRQDEAKFLEKKGAYAFGHYGQMKCPHIRAFHEAGTTRYGGPCWTCPICQKYEEEDPAYWEDRAETLERSARAEIRNARIAWTFIGALLSSAVWAWWFLL